MNEVIVEVSTVEPQEAMELLRQYGLGGHVVPNNETPQDALFITGTEEVIEDVLRQYWGAEDDEIAMYFEAAIR